MVIWIVGLPGSGKTTLAKKLYKQLSPTQKVIHIDGDDMREIWGEDLQFTLEDRSKNSRRIQKLSALFEKQGCTVIVSIMSIFETHRKKNRKLYKQYYEIFLDVKIETLKERRSIYQDALDEKIKNVVGVDIPYEAPTTYDLIFQNQKDLNFMVKEVQKNLERLYV